MATESIAAAVQFTTTPSGGIRDKCLYILNDPQWCFREFEDLLGILSRLVYYMQNLNQRIDSYTIVLDSWVEKGERGLGMARLDLFLISEKRGLVVLKLEIPLKVELSPPKIHN
ncbi:uncharacterized protein EAF01_005823 [Botrytis porri]|uniref:Uncharacterized protein n=1 Tax=Botrytis porri TaxID=87229 RepID=A0A4Z1L5U7_9HELO|nr:uncharacterized protein EAF01_005823 [Botrytis porri]KAF7905302.1 hypothetical protein EAF01_005823 [Botrytis porri]TGO92202.1 hypothetical protein BPOR_0008g00420 [Botrytis porri]